jgi:hypothetical protein
MTRRLAKKNLNLFSTGPYDLFSIKKKKLIHYRKDISAGL